VSSVPLAVKPVFPVAVSVLYALSVGLQPSLFVVGEVGL
jgi:hypothetical protein